MLTTADEQIAGYSGADFRRLSEAASCDAFGQHRLVDSPEHADIILLIPIIGMLDHILFCISTGRNAFYFIPTIT
jgi:hypothetical protein